VLDRGVHAFAGRQQLAAERGECDPAAAPHAQRHADMRFQPLEGRADTGLLPVERPGGRANAAMAGDFAKNLEQGPIDITREHGALVQQATRFAHGVNTPDPSLRPRLRTACKSGAGVGNRELRCFYANGSVCPIPSFLALVQMAWPSAMSVMLRPRCQSR